MASRCDFPYLAAMPLSQVTSEHMGRWRDARLAGIPERGLAPVGAATVLREINLYSHVFTTRARRMEMDSREPVRRHAATERATTAPQDYRLC